MKQEKLLEIVNLFMNDSDEKALKRLYELTNDKLVKILIDWKNEYDTLLQEPQTCECSMYNDIVEYLWDKYHLAELPNEKVIFDDRKNEIFNKLVDYVFEHTDNDKEFYNALTSIIGLTDDEIESLEIDVSSEIEIE